MEKWTTQIESTEQLCLYLVKPHPINYLPLQLPIYTLFLLTKLDSLSSLDLSSLWVVLVFHFHFSASSMAASSSREAMNKQLLDFIHSMEQEGLVDYRFAKVHMLKESSGPFFFASLLPTFCRDSTATLRDLTVALGQPLLNYHDLGELCFKIRGGAACLGVCRMAHACGQLHQAVQNRATKERLITALNAAKQEFSIMQEKLETLAQLETKIVSNEADGP
ncbi:hypothetical protein ES332_A05G316800v1 [Gossypium tomentosum]|nr:hypothetical protein ES332_A05G316800v1 [Gossypium tomentosum]